MRSTAGNRPLLISAQMAGGSSFDEALADDVDEALSGFWKDALDANARRESQTRSKRRIAEIRRNRCSSRAVLQGDRRDNVEGVLSAFS